MAVVSREQIKSWFRRGLKPLESHFASWIDSFWHKNDSIPMSSIDGLTDALNQRTIIVDDALSATSENPVQNKVLKTALNNIQVDVDSSLNGSSENPVQNKVVTIALGNKADVEHSHQMSDVNGLSAALVAKQDTIEDLSSIREGAALGATALQQHQDISGKQDKTDNSLPTTSKTIIGAIAELWNKFADYALANHNHNGVYQPAGDYASRSHGHSIAAVEGLSDALAGKAATNHNHDGVYQPVGNYLTQHQDISGKQDKTDNSLPTTSKTIIGAIAELWNKFADYALANHNHDAAYAAKNHNHEGVYQPAGSYAAANHNHDSAYAPLGHNHDSAYAAKNHTHSQYLTQHQDISGKQDKTDNSLPTTSKTIIGAISELWNKFTDYLKGIQHVTYAQLVTLRNDEELVPGQRYRITDYVTSVPTTIEARSAGHPFDIIVQALDDCTLSEEAYARPHSGNSYFENCQLQAWRLKYCLDNDTNRFAFANTTNGKGVIYEMVDEYNNRAPYDFKNIMFKRYKILPMLVLKDSSPWNRYECQRNPDADAEINGTDYYAYKYGNKNYYIEDEQPDQSSLPTIYDENGDEVENRRCVWCTPIDLQGKYRIDYKKRLR